MERMNELDEAYYVSEMMMTFGGSFVKNLGKALRVADPNNRKIIKREFSNYYNEYLEMYENREKMKD